MQAVRLQKVMAQAGVASRRHAEKLISQGRVMVNGQKVTQMGTLIDPDSDVVHVDGRRVHQQTSRRYVLLHKPPGCVTTCDDEQGRPTVLDLLPPHPGRLFPVGRLDVNSEGVLLLTNDGQLAHQLLHPRYRIPRVYVVQVHGTVTERDVTRLRRGVTLDDGKTLPAHVQIIRQVEKNCTLRLTLYEGRHRQIHRMLECCGPYRVKRLQRTAMGPLTLTGLPPGGSRSLEPFEVARLQRLCRSPHSTASSRGLVAG